VNYGSRPSCRRQGRKGKQDLTHHWCAAPREHHGTLNERVQAREDRDQSGFGGYVPTGASWSTCQRQMRA
jgi:hypothetical protein